MRGMASTKTLTLSLIAALLPACGQVYTSTATDAEGSSSSTTEATSEATTTDTPTTGATTTASTTGATTDESSSSGGTTDGGVPTGGCGAPAYEWLPSAGMGDVIAFDEVIEFSAEQINKLLEDAGFGAFGPVEFGSRVYKFRYVTQDRGEAVEATGFMAFPVGQAPEERPVVVWAHGTTGFSDQCAPTADPLEGFQIPLILGAKGFVSVAPDYIGMNGWGPPSNRLHPYIVPEPTAIAVLDSARALYQFAAMHADLPSLPGDDIILFGASEGGFATLWADRYAPHYAPELHIVANIAGVPPTDAIGLTKHGMTVFGPTTGALAAAVVGSWDWAGRQAPLSDVFSSGPPVDVASELPKMMETTCSLDLPDGLTATNQVYEQSFIDAVIAEDWEATEPWSCYLRRASLGESEIPLLSATPTLITQGELDDLVYTPVVREDLPRLCDQGYLIEHVECAGAGHVDGVVLAIPYALRWVEDRLAGKPLADPCTIHPPTDCTQL